MTVCRWFTLATRAIIHRVGAKGLSLSYDSQLASSITEALWLGSVPTCKGEVVDPAEGRPKRRLRRRTVVLLASLVAFCLVVASVVIFRPNPLADGTAVPDGGADVTIAGARIVVPPGAAPAGSKVQASLRTGCQQASTSLS